MNQRKTILLLLGLLLFGLMLFAVNMLAVSIERYGKQFYDVTMVYLLNIPLYTLIALGTVLLRLDLLVRFLRLKPTFHWPTFMLFGWPFLLFVVILPIFIHLFPQIDALMIIYFNFHHFFGRHASVLTSVLFGLGFVWALNDHST